MYSEIDLKQIHGLMFEIATSLFYTPKEPSLDIGYRRLYYPTYDGEESQFYNLICQIIPKEYIEGMIEKYESLVGDNSVLAKQKNFILIIPTDLTYSHRKAWRASCPKENRELEYSSYLCKVTSEEPTVEMHIQDKCTLKYLAQIYPDVTKLYSNVSVVFNGDKDTSEIIKGKGWKTKELFYKIGQEHIGYYISEYLDRLVGHRFWREEHVLSLLKDDGYLRTVDQLKEFNLDKLEYIRNRFKNRFDEERLKLIINLMYIYYHNNLNPFVDIFKQN